MEVAAACAEGVALSGCDPDPCHGGRRRRGHDADPRRRARRSIVRPGNRSARTPDRGGAWARRRDAIVEVAAASACAARALRALDPERATTAGTGELIVAAREEGASRILVAAGGSATVDGGAGAIEAIRSAGGLGECRLTVLCDVETAFEDAAHVYGPQKGATPDAVRRLAARLERLAAELPRDPGVPMTGAAGGLAGGLWAALGAELRPAPSSSSTPSISTGGSTARTRPSSERAASTPRASRGKAVSRIAARCRRAGAGPRDRRERARWHGSSEPGARERPAGFGPRRAARRGSGAGGRPRQEVATARSRSAARPSRCRRWSCR